MNKTFDLEERTTKFGIEVIDLCKIIPKNTLTIPIIDQLIRSGTSVGANYMEANGAASRRDFKNKITICRKEAKETHYWLTLLNHVLTEDIQVIKLQQESKELALIFSKIILNT